MDLQQTLLRVLSVLSKGVSPSSNLQSQPPITQRSQPSYHQNRPIVWSSTPKARSTLKSSMMNPVYLCFLGLLCCAALAARASAAEESKQQLSADATTTTTATATLRKDVTDEMQLINKSLEGLLNELAIIKREATGRLSQVKKSGGLTASENERIRQTKVSRFVLKRVAELESESLGMRDEMNKLFELQKKTISARSSSSSSSAQPKQEDVGFEGDEVPAATGLHRVPSSTTTTTTTSTTMKTPAEQEQEAAQIGFDLEQLKRLGNELESEIESRQAQNPESIRGVHEQIIKLTDQMVQNYLGSVRRVIHRFNNLLGDNRRSGLTPNSSGHHHHHHQPAKQSAPTVGSGGQEEEERRGPQLGEPVVNKLEGVTKQFKQFSEEFPKALERQSSPLIDRIPPRGVELWRDFWDTVRKQFRRINQEFLQVSRDMGRLLTGRQPSTGASRVVVVRPRENEQQAAPNAAAVVAPLANLLYSSSAGNEQLAVAAVEKQFQEFYDKLSAQLRLEQQKMDELSKASGEQQQQQSTQRKQVQETQEDNNNNNNNNKVAYELIEEIDDEQTRQVLTQNPGLRQQISQDINVFSSIFDIIRTFLSRLRGSAEDIRNILERPGAMRDNNSVTPGPAVKPTVDQLLKDTIDSQRNINSQARPTGR